METLRKSLLLYAITDRSWLLGKALSEQVERALAGGARMIQLREKTLDYPAFLEEATLIKKLTQRYGVPLIINDNVEIALACGADGVHIGQSDMNIGKCREILGEKAIIGVTAKTVEQALLAEEEGADYLGCGAVFLTSTKPAAVAMSHQTLKEICSSVKIPVVAIGGITSQNILELATNGVSGVAVVAAIFAQPNIERATKEMLVLATKMVLA